MDRHLGNSETEISASDQKKADRELSEYLAKKYGAAGKPAAPKARPLADFEEGDDDGIWSKINFDMKPEELASYLDQYIVRQDRAKAVLATKICTHFNRARYLSRMEHHDPADGVGLIKNNILMIGPTGVGKTYMVKLIAAKLGVPFVKGDATKFSETGYVGGDVEDLVRDLLAEADDDMELAGYGIVYIDEIDKIASSRHLLGPDVSRTGVQRALLKPMEETEVDLKVAHDPISQIQAIEAYRKTGKREKRSINTRHILFIMSGAFSELPEVIRRRLHKQEVGFGAQVRSKGRDQEYFQRISAQDLVEFGFETEFVGRLPVTVVLEELDADDLYQILKNPNNPVIISKKRDFAAYDIDLYFEDAALKLLADQAAELKTGARGLVSAVEKALLPFEKHLPSTEITELLVTPEMVADPEAHLEAVLSCPDDQDTCRRRDEAVKAERLELLKMIAKRQSLYADRLPSPLSPARMDLIAGEYYRSAMSLGAAFEKIIKHIDALRGFEAAFFDRYGIKITLSEDAEVAILEGAAAEGISLRRYCQKLGHILEPGLKLVQDKTGRAHFSLEGDAINATETWLHRLIQDHYNQNLAAGRDGADNQ